MKRALGYLALIVLISPVASFAAPQHLLTCRTRETDDTLTPIARVQVWRNTTADETSYSLRIYRSVLGSAERSEYTLAFPGRNDNPPVVTSDSYYVQTGNESINITWQRLRRRWSGTMRLEEKRLTNNGVQRQLRTYTGVQCTQP